MELSWGKGEEASAKAIAGRGLPHQSGPPGASRGGGGGALTGSGGYPGGAFMMIGGSGGTTAPRTMVAFSAAWCRSAISSICRRVIPAQRETCENAWLRKTIIDQAGYTDLRLQTSGYARDRCQHALLRKWAAMAASDEIMNFHQFL